MNQRIQKIHIVVLALAVLCVVAVQVQLQQPNVPAILGPVLAFLTSFGFYQILTSALLSLINHNETFLKIFWGKSYLKGYWSYTYLLDGKSYKGIWSIEQDIYGTRIFGTGLDNKLGMRSMSYSVTDIIVNNGIFDVVMIRLDGQSGIENYTRTIMLPQCLKSKGLTPSVPHRLRALTHNFGGTAGGKAYSNVVMIKHEDAKSEDDIIEFFRSQAHKQDKSPIDSGDTVNVNN